MSEFVIDDRETPRFRVNRRAFVDQEVFELERRRIFDQSWLYVGHESEIPHPDDYRARRVGGRELILARDHDGAVRVFFNSCTHRGSLLCREEAGNGRFLKCIYHAWSFDTSGNLVAIPDDEAYGPTFDRENLCLVSPPRVDSYRGFVFVSYAPDIVDLAAYLGPGAGVIDRVADQHEGGGMEIVRGTHKYSMRANWKLIVENSMDGYHVMSTHARYLQMYKNRIERTLGPEAVKAAMQAIALRDPRQGGWDLGHGHSMATFGRVDPGGAHALRRMLPTQSAREKETARQARLNERNGVDYMAAVNSGGNALIFPNLGILDLGFAMTIRKIDPVAPDYIEITAWEFAPADEDPELRAARAEDYLTFWGPAGLATPDDVEALEACQRGYTGHREQQWNDISRGMGRVPTITDEYHMRVFWRRWNELMTGEHLEPEALAAPPDFLTAAAGARAEVSHV